MRYSNENRPEATAFKGSCIVVSEASTFFGGPKSKPYRSEILNNPTWGDLMRCARAQQKATGDRHHNFFEDYEFKGVERVDGQLVSVLKLFLGS